MAKWYPFIHEHVSCKQKSLSQHCRMQAHYLSPNSQNEFFAACSNLVMHHILDEKKSAKYYAVIADATPNILHKEQTTFMMRYVLSKEGAFEVEERFFQFSDCNAKTGDKIANMII